MAGLSPTAITQLLRDWGEGDQQALDQLIPVVYRELHRLAEHYLRGERPDHTLEPTALVHEAYLRLADWHGVTWQNRAHFFGVAAQLMRRILVDYARRHRAAKRGAGAPKITLSRALGSGEERGDEEAAEDLVALDEALSRLAQLDPRQGRIVELRYFSGLTVEEIAEVLGISPATVKREWSMARAWLSRALRDGSRGGTGVEQS
jgi:RNA polymerase sigma-70 factor (ECF subfamily)